MKIRTLVVDSSYLLKRSLHGAKDVYTSRFGHIGGLYSFLTTLRKLIKDYKINKVILVWDGEQGGYYRHIIDPSYKANRKNKDWYNKIELTDSEIKFEMAKEESILKQKKRIQAYAEELFLRQIEVDKIEADDLIAEYCSRYHEMEDIYIYTNDRDFAQLLELNITILFGNIEEPITKRNFFFEFNYHHSNALAMKVICGDVSDNLKGINGLAEKTLIKHFPDLKFKNLTIREICSKADMLNIERVKNKKKPLKNLLTLIDNIPLLKNNHKLMNLSEPFLNEQAYEDLSQLDIPLSDENRNSKNLYNMMIEDEFLSVYGGTFPNYVEPYYSIIMHEKKLLKEYNKHN
jgi:DNA polymerase-1